MSEPADSWHTETETHNRDTDDYIVPLVDNATSAFVLWPRMKLKYTKPEPKNETRPNVKTIWWMATFVKNNEH